MSGSFTTVLVNDNGLLITDFRAQFETQMSVEILKNNLQVIIARI